MDMVLLFLVFTSLVLGVDEAYARHRERARTYVHARPR